MSVWLKKILIDINDVKDELNIFGISDKALVKFKCNIVDAFAMFKAHSDNFDHNFKWKN